MGTAWRRCSSAFHGSSATPAWYRGASFISTSVWSPVFVRLWLKLHSLSRLFSPVVPKRLASKLWHQKGPCVFTLISHLSNFFMTLTSTSGGTKGLGYPFYSGASGGSVYLFLSLRREISWVCWRISFSSRLVKSEYSSSWISIRLVWFSTCVARKGGDSNTVGTDWKMG